MKPDPSRAVRPRPIKSSRDRSMASPKRSVRSAVDGSPGGVEGRGVQFTKRKRPEKSHDHKDFSRYGSAELHESVKKIYVDTVRYYMD